MTDDPIADAKAFLADPPFTEVERIADRIIRRLVARVEANPPLVWTDAKPTVPGKFWWRLHKNDPPEHWEIVTVCKDVFAVTDEEGFQMKLRKYEGQFAGPIPSPADTREGDETR